MFANTALVCLVVTLSLMAASTQAEDNRNAEQRTFFFGSHAEKLQKWSNFLRLKAIVKSKVLDCKRIHFCNKGAIKRLLLGSSQTLDDLMSYLSDNHPGILGAIATGWMRRDCEKSYPNCAIKLRIDQSPIPCAPGEACFREEANKAASVKAGKKQDGGDVKGDDNVAPVEENGNGHGGETENVNGKGTSPAEETTTVATDEFHTGAVVEV